MFFVRLVYFHLSRVIASANHPSPQDKFFTFNSNKAKFYYKKIFENHIHENHKGQICPYVGDKIAKEKGKRRDLCGISFTEFDTFDSYFGG